MSTDTLHALATVVSSFVRYCVCVALSCVPLLLVGRFGVLWLFVPLLYVPAMFVPLPLGMTSKTVVYYIVFWLPSWRYWITRSNTWLGLQIAVMAAHVTVAVAVKYIW